MDLSVKRRKLLLGIAPKDLRLILYAQRWDLCTPKGKLNHCPSFTLFTRARKRIRLKTMTECDVKLGEAVNQLRFRARSIIKT